eukprot:TRINITY_DN13809_c0_g1_i1.p1 TRINITY_DN13809_c0_g1~~TRINITY_DN13809_c0_g1_i1.p1  ORF type:complete len:164 (-),score=39.58 TRINITY_DN13809_c0_g1_i1:5-496(-)
MSQPVSISETVDFASVSKLAYEIWPGTYEAVIPKEQIYYMLDRMYTIESLTKQHADEHTFLMLHCSGQSMGFVSFSPGKEDGLYRIHKLYVHQSVQGKGYGKLLVDAVAQRAKQLGATCLELNVNRNNPALNFYKKLGFKITLEEDIPYGPFILNDYRLQLTI